jgi:trans-aconitate methyltransferase
VQDSERVRDFYDEFVDYQLRYLTTPNPRFLEIRKRLGPVIDRRRPASALDIGCGIGVQTAWLASRVPHVAGVDIAPRNIRVASRLYEHISFAVCTLPGQALPEGPFELVTAFDVLEHLNGGDRAATFVRIADVLADDGVLAVNIPSRLFALRNPPETQQIIDEAVGLDELVAPAAAVGLELLSLDRYGVDAVNQYVFLVFGRSYDVESPPGRLSVLERLRRRGEAWLVFRRGTRLLDRVRDL